MNLKPEDFLKMKNLKVEFNPDNKAKLLMAEPDKVNAVKLGELSKEAVALIVAFYN